MPARAAYSRSTSDSNRDPSPSVRILLVLVKHATNPDAITDYAVHDGEWIPKHYQFPCPRYLAAAADVREALELFGLSTNLRDHSVSSALTVFWRRSLQ